MIQKITNFFINFYNTKRKVFFGTVIGIAVLIIGGIVFSFLLRLPDPPEDLRVTVRSYDTVNLTWIDPHRSDGYNVYRSKELEADYERVATTSNRHYLDTELDPETTYYYRITKIVGEKESLYSSEVHATTESVGTVSGLKAGEVGHDYIKLEWDGFDRSEGYTVYRSEGRDRPYIQIRSTNNNYYFDSDLERNTPYYYVVTQIIDGEESEYSTQLEVATRDWTCGTAINYDGNFYRTVEIGGRCWFAENLDYETETGSWCYGEEASNCDRYGMLYNFETAMGGSSEEKAQGICPEGWYIPTDEEFKIMERSLGMGRLDSNDSGWRGGELNVGDKMKSANNCSERGENFCGSSRFDVLLGGTRSSAGAFRYFETHSFLWTSTVANDVVWKRLFSANNSGVRRDMASPQNGYYVRCIQE